MPIVVLDSHPLSLLSNPRTRRKEPLQCKVWAKDLLTHDIPIFIPGAVDYELRRQLILSQEAESIDELDKIRNTFAYAPTSDEVFKRAADLWAWARRTNQQTSHGEEIDIDVLLAAQAITLAENYGEYVIVATSNVKHIERYTPAREWKSITVEHCFDPRIPVASSEK